MSIIERKIREKKQMKDIILKAAMELFLKDGFENVTIRKIAKEIDYSPTTIYIYFKDKDEIFKTLQKIAFKKFRDEQLKTSIIEDPYERFLEHGKSYVKFALNNPGYYDLMFILNEPVKNVKKPEDWVEGLDAYEYLKSNIRELMNANLLKESSVEIAAFSIWSYVHGIASLIIRRGMLIPEEFKKIIVEGSIEYMMQNLLKKEK